MSSFIALRKTLDLSADNNRHLLVGRQSRDLPQVAENGAIVTALKKHYDMSVDVQFDSNGGTACDGMTYVLGSTYKDLPVPTRAQHIFNGWATATGQILTDSSLVELSNTTLTAQWEYVDIGSDCTEYIVSCNSSYKNTGIYAANRYSSTSAVYVDWGDGNVDKVDGNISKLSHSYTNAGTYSVKVSNNLTSFAPSYNDSTWYNTTSQNRYTFRSMVKTGSRMTSTAAMPSYAFYYCSSLSSIDWLSSCCTGLTALPSYAFYYCQGVKSLSSLPSRIKSLGSYAFYYCTGLTGIQDLRSTGLTSLYNSNVFQYCSNIKEWKLPSTLTGTYFGSYVFGNNSALSAIQLPESLTAIASNCFYSDTQLKNISIPSKVQSIGNYAFYGCTTLSNVSIEATSLTSINQYAFYNCSKLTGIDLPDTVKTIGNYALYGCASLDYIGRIANDLPYDAEIEYLENDGKQWIDTAIIPTESDEAEMLVYFKSDDSSGSKVLFGTATPRLWVTTGTCRFNEENKCAIHNKRILNEWNSIKINKDICVCNGTEIQMSDGTFQFTQNTVWLFGVNSSLAKTNARIKSFIWKRNNIEILNFIPVRVGNVGYMYDKVSGQLFGNSGTGNFILGPDVKTKQLPSQLTSIGSYACQGCINLKSLDIPSTLTVLNDYAFAGCYNLSSIVDRRLTAQATYTNTFGNTASNNASNGYTGYATHGSNILCTYAAATGYDDGYWNDPLQNTTKCGFNRQYIDPENLRYCIISFDAGEGTVSETSRQVVYGRKIGELPKPTCPADKPYFGGWYTEADGAGTKYSANSTAPSQDSLTLYAFYSAVQLKSYTVDLNGQWRQSTTQTNPDSAMYDGVYESNSNYHVNNGFAKMYVRISGYDEFTIYIRSYGESSYDYTLAFNPDVDVASNPSYGTSGVKAHTRGNQQSGQAIGNYKQVTYTGLGGGDHFICIVYRKDSSVNSGNDRGYVLIPKDQ